MQQPITAPPQGRAVVTAQAEVVYQGNSHPKQPVAPIQPEEGRMDAQTLLTTPSLSHTPATAKLCPHKQLPSGMYLRTQS